MSQQLIIVDANENGNFQFRNSQGDDAYYLSATLGDEIGWICFRAAGEIGYEIVFSKKSPFSERSTISVPNGGHSGFSVLDQGDLGSDFKYTVIIPSLNWQHDPDVLIDAVIMTAGERVRVDRQQITFTKPEANCIFDPNYAPNVAGKRVYWFSRVGPYSIEFNEYEWPFVTPYEVIESRDDGHTSALLASSNKGTYRYVVNFDDGTSCPGLGLEIK